MTAPEECRRIRRSRKKLNESLMAPVAFSHNSLPGLVVSVIVDLVMGSGFIGYCWWADPVVHACNSVSKAVGAQATCSFKWHRDAQKVSTPAFSIGVTGHRGLATLAFDVHLRINSAGWSH